MRKGHKELIPVASGGPHLLTKARRMMLEKITKALKARKELADWSVRHIVNRQAQVYLVGQKTESL